MSDRTARGFVLDRRPFREHDLRADLLLEDGDRVEVLAPSGQRSKQRFAGGLTPMALHRFAMTLSPRGMRLDEARIERAWPPLHADLTRQTVALGATAFARDAAGASPGDPTAFLLLAELHEHVAADADPRVTPSRLMRFAVEMLEHGGHAPVLDRCVRCEASAPEASLVTVDPAAGGVVCRSCGGGPFRLTAIDRAALRAIARGESDRYAPGLVSTLARVISGVSPEGAKVLAQADEVFTRAGSR